MIGRSAWRVEETRTLAGPPLVLPRNDLDRLAFDHLDPLDHAPNLCRDMRATGLDQLDLILGDGAITLEKDAMAD